MIGSFDRIGFQRHSRAFRAADVAVDLAGRVWRAAPRLATSSSLQRSAARRRAGPVS
jgi:hypothetical protein